MLLKALGMLQTILFCNYFRIIPLYGIVFVNCKMMLLFQLFNKYTLQLLPIKSIEPYLINCLSKIG